MNIQYLTRVRERNPLIHNITNLVSANFTANGLLALGASPIMADSLDEMAELTSLSHALVINLGTPNELTIPAMLSAGKAANKAGIPVIFDPVAVGVSQLRRDTAARLLNEIQFSAIRGNAGEIAYLAGIPWQGKGVDAGEGDADLAFVAKTAAQRHQCLIALTGKTDYITDGKTLAYLKNGSPLLPKITASGCLLSAVCGAFLAVSEQSTQFNALIEACAMYAIAGELAAETLSETQCGTFSARFLDALACINHQQIAMLTRIQWGK